ncbi:DUF58 domain-containing protein [Humibacillus xanthopallidus]|uniref:Uncharacterized protein DUF58 n=1 Tax=Humibacillus xanthopallidus TaxID=412689 RepID=A0A543HA18_9MICO|nr:DUF58 domain-containing protein [Humibacillus xanthopallidus]TQM55150.1 uncharacterized protein DUF58 [Humibacillus xanthopallidus]
MTLQQEQNPAPTPRPSATSASHSNPGARATSGATRASAATGPRAVVADLAGATSRGIRQVTAPLTRSVGHVTQVSEGVWRPVAGVLRWVSPLGWTIVGLGVVCWVVGAHWGWTELLMVAAAALVLVAICFALAVGRTRVRILAEVDPRRVVVGEPATGRIVVTNEARTPMLPLLVELPVGLSAARFVLPPLTPGDAHEELFVVPTSRRGVIQVGPATTVQGDPLGLMRRTLTWTQRTELFVHPRTVALESLGAGLLRDLEGSTTEDVSMSDLAFHALREYQPGDDRRYIHWRSSAKAGKLLVRQFLDTRRSHVTIVVDPDPEQYRSGHGRTGRADATDRATATAGGTDGSSRGGTRDLLSANAPSALEVDVETAISIGSSIMVRVMLDEQDATLVCRDQRVSKAGPQLGLDAMARVVPGPVDLLTTSLDAVDLAPDTSTVFLVTGPHRPLLDLQRAAGQFAPEVSKVVIVVDPRAEHGIRRGGGLTILTVGRLEQLRTLLVAGVAR